MALVTNTSSARGCAAAASATWNGRHRRSSRGTTATSKPAVTSACANGSRMPRLPPSAADDARIARKFDAPMEKPSANRLTKPMITITAAVKRAPSTPLTTVNVVINPSFAPYTKSAM